MEPLRPRFKIQKSRLSSDDSAENDFTPDKVIYVEIDDEITQVFDRLKNLRVRRIALVIPKRATLLQSIVNLKILKKKILESDKEIVIVTSDIPGLQMAKKAGIPAVERLFEKEKTPASKEKIALKAGERPIRVLEKKVSISEVIHQEKPDFLSLMASRVKERLKKHKQENRTRLVFIAPNKQALFTLILVSVLLLLVIAYIALPGATIILTPRTTVLDPSFNTVFLDYEKNKSVIENDLLNTLVAATFPVDPPPFTKKFTFPSTGKIFQGEFARGNIIITNLSASPWDLAPQTRFQNDQGIVFRTPNAVRVPPARGNVPGTLEISVIADAVDANGQIIGERGNILPSKFFLPGLKNEENRKKLFGESTTPMAGGITKTVKIVSQEDIAAAQEQTKRDIAKNAAEDLKKFLEQQNIVKKTNFSLLTDPHAWNASELRIVIPENLAGSRQDQFEIVASYSVNGIAFDREKLIAAIKERLISYVDPDKKIIRIADTDIAFKFLDEDEPAGKIRFTATIRAIQAYELDPEKENGHRFIKKISDHILGAKVSDAAAYLQQQTDEIAAVEIKTWPIWAPTIPNIADNIKFEIRQENTLQP